MSKDPRDIILKPVVSEKSYALLDRNVYTFVVAPTANIGPGSLSGTYAGATGSATIGVGVGANVLVGGSGNSIALQPVSIEGTTGLNVAAGIAEITLTFQPV